MNGLPGMSLPPTVILSLWGPQAVEVYWTVQFPDWVGVMVHSTCWELFGAVSWQESRLGRRGTEGIGRDKVASSKEVFCPAIATSLPFPMATT